MPIATRTGTLRLRPAIHESVKGERVVGQLANGWYAIQVRPKSERFVAQHLTGKGYETFVPMYVARRKWSDRVKQSEQPLIPNYVFCEMGGDVVAPIVTTPSVIRFVGCGREIYPIEPHEMDALQRVNAHRLGAPWPGFSEGQSVEIQEGPLTGLRGVLVRIKGGHRLVLTVSQLQRSISVEIDEAAVAVI